MSSESVEPDQSRKRIQDRAVLLDVAGQAVIATDARGRIVYWNATAETLYGWTAAEALDREIVEVTPSALSREDAHGIMEQLGSGKSWSGNFLVQRKDGTPFWAAVRNTPLRDDLGELIGVIGVSSATKPARRPGSARRRR